MLLYLTYVLSIYVYINIYIYTQTYLYLCKTYLYLCIHMPLINQHKQCKITSHLMGNSAYHVALMELLLSHGQRACTMV